MEVFGALQCYERFMPSFLQSRYEYVLFQTGVRGRHSALVRTA